MYIRCLLTARTCPLSISDRCSSNVSSDGISRSAFPSANLINFYIVCFSFRQLLCGSCFFFCCFVRLVSSFERAANKNGFSKMRRSKSLTQTSYLGVPSRCTWCLFKLFFLVQLCVAIHYLSSNRLFSSKCIRPNFVFHFLRRPLRPSLKP